MEEKKENSEFTTVVIISLPPADNPSLGKTITAFTVSDSPPFQNIDPEQPNNHHENHPPHQPSQLNHHLEHHSSFKNFLFGSSRLLFGILSIALIAYSFYISVFEETLSELRETNDDHKFDTFILPLYPKMGTVANVQGNIELKLGKFVGLDSSDAVLGNGKKTTSMLAKSKFDSNAIVPVNGNIFPDGLYYTVMQLGQPPKPYYLDIDTGSDLTWIQCDAPCSSCAKGAHPLYKPKKENILPSKDTSCVDVQRNLGTKDCKESCNQCDYEIGYADYSSTMGVLARDKLHLQLGNGSLVKSNVAFGCAYDQQGYLLNTLTKSDGIIGLSKAKISLPSQLASQGIIKNVIGHCIPSKASGEGYMFLGDGFVPYRGMTYVQMHHSPAIDTYHAMLMKISYGRRDLSLRSRIHHGPGSVIFDSGSSLTYIVKDLYNEIIIAITNEVLPQGFNLDTSDDTLPICWQANFPVRSVEDVSSYFKPLTLQFGNMWWIMSTLLHIPPEGYLIINKNGAVCLGILDGGKVLGTSVMILGDISLRGKMFVYDNVHKKIGWMKSDCTRPT